MEVDITYHSQVSDTERKVESGRSFRSCVLLSLGQREGRGEGEACREKMGGLSYCHLCNVGSSGPRKASGR